jgi:hypothetical protein
MWLCECECRKGKLTIVKGGSLTSGDTRSCGCLRTEAALRIGFRSHCMDCGMPRHERHSPEYRTYRSAKDRRQRPSNKSYVNYGGRGVRFLYASFREFLADLGRKPHAGMSIERIDNDGHYEPGNCRWATRTEQNNNKRRNRLLTVFGRTQTLTQWARECGVHVSTMQDRLRHGMPLDRALSARKGQAQKADAS